MDTWWSPRDSNNNSSSKSKRLKYRLLLALLLGLSLLSPIIMVKPFAHPTVVITVESKFVSPGEKTTIKISATGVLAPGIANIQGKLRFDPTVLKVLKVNFARNFNLKVANIVSGEVKFTAGVTTGTPLGEGTLLELEVEAIGEGGDSSSLELTLDVLSDPDFNPIEHEIINGRFAIGEVPPAPPPEENEPPRADFTSSPSEPAPGDTVQFTDKSTDPDGEVVSWFWDFGDGTGSTEQNPTHQYGEAGTYTVELTVEDDDGATDSVSKEITVVVPNQPPQAEFSFSPQKPKVGEEVQFTDESSDPDGEVVSWSWDFGDGSTSSERNPSHKYSDAGTFTVTLTVTDDKGDKDSVSKEITVAPAETRADFAYEPDEPVVGEVIRFIDRSVASGYIVSWLWDFGDGMGSTEQNPTHEYAEAGTYTVKLVVEDDKGATAIAIKKIRVSESVNQPPRAGFTFAPAQPTTADIVRFKDESEDPDGVIVSWLWDFGDGTGSSEQDPAHQYSEAGTYTVKLIVEDDEGATGFTYQEITVVEVGQPPTADFAFSPAQPEVGELVQFTDRSHDPDGEIVEWLWDFGDGETSTLRSPTHAYSAAGIYAVRLTVTDDSGLTSIPAVKEITVGTPPQADFAFSPAQPGVGELVQFTDRSHDPDGEIVSWEWDFGDGTTSAERSPSHTYAEGGTYTVRLTVTDNDGLSSSTTKQVRVGIPAAEVEVHAFPNPAADRVTFEYLLPAGTERAVLRVFDSLGKLVFHRELEVAKTEFIWDLKSDQGRALPNGPYFYRVVAFDREGRSTSSKLGKLIIQKRS